MTPIICARCTTPARYDVAHCNAEEPLCSGCLDALVEQGRTVGLYPVGRGPWRSW